VTATGRIAVCGNVLPADTPEQVLAAVSGPFARWAAALRSAGGPSPALGLAVSAAAAAAFAADPAARRRLQAALAAAGVTVWTANAFPFGGFQGDRVGPRAFLPDWTDPARLAFTRDVARLLVDLVPVDPTGVRRGSLSTCPVGYGPAAVADPRTRRHLEGAALALEELAAATGVELALGLEPEPDGGFERVADLASFLAALDAPPGRLGVCLDLCHLAVVGEDPGAAVAALAAHHVPLAKVQVSAALRLAPDAPPGTMALLSDLAADPWLHQVRADDGGAWPDLAPYLEQRARPSSAVRIHAHVPLHLAAPAPGLAATDWRGGLAAVRAAVAEAALPTPDLEVETYTLTRLSPTLRGGTLEEVLLAETLACAEAAA